MNTYIKNLDALAIKSGWIIKQASNCIRIYEIRKVYPSKTIVTRIYIKGTKTNGWPALVDKAEYRNHRRIKSNQKDIAGLNEIKKIIRSKNNNPKPKTTTCSFDETYMSK